MTFAGDGCQHELLRFRVKFVAALTLERKLGCVRDNSLKSLQISRKSKQTTSKTLWKQDKAFLLELSSISTP